MQSTSNRTTDDIKKNLEAKRTVPNASERQG